MKLRNTVKLGVAMMVSFLMINPTIAQKKVKSIKMDKVLDIPADKVWAVVGEDYGAIAYSHPRIIASNYINGSLEAGEGAERICLFNEKGTQFLKEKISFIC